MGEGTNDPSFSREQKRVLASVLDEIIPPSADGKMPGAGQVGVADHLEKALQAMPDLRSMVTEGLSELDQASRTRHGRAFLELAEAEKRALLSEQGFVIALTLHTYVGYYQNPRVVAALGMEVRAPHPQGYEMAPDDPTLLDPVRRRAKLYRDC